MAQTFNPKKNLEYELEVGDSLFLGETYEPNEVFSIKYAGMPSRESFSIIKHEGNNLFYSATQRYISTLGFSSQGDGLFGELSFEVMDVNPEKIKLKYLGKEK